MKTRFDKLVVVRAAASRMATAGFLDAAADLAGHEALASRLESAAAALSPEPGLAAGAAFASRSELASRMQAAHLVTTARVKDARQAFDDGANARRAARRALDAAVDIRRAHGLARVARREAKILPVKPKDAGL